MAITSLNLPVSEKVAFVNTLLISSAVLVKIALYNRIKFPILIAGSTK